MLGQHVQAALGHAQRLDRAGAHPLHHRGALQQLRRVSRDEHPPTARADRVPQVQWPGGVLYRYRSRLYATTPASSAPLPACDWLAQAPLRLPDGRVLPALPGLFDAPLRVAPRRGGEKIRLHAQRPRRPLRLLLQEYGVPPWQRAQLPYLWQGDTLLAVGDLFLDAAFAERLRDAGHVWRVESAPQPG